MCPQSPTGPPALTQEGAWPDPPVIPISHRAQLRPPRPPLCPPHAATTPRGYPVPHSIPVPVPMAAASHPHGNASQLLRAPQITAHPPPRNTLELGQEHVYTRVQMGGHTHERGVHVWSCRHACACVCSYAGTGVSAGSCPSLERACEPARMRAPWVRVQMRVCKCTSVSAPTPLCEYPRERVYLWVCVRADERTRVSVPLRKCVHAPVGTHACTPLHPHVSTCVHARVGAPAVYTCLEAHARAQTRSLMHAAVPVPGCACVRACMCTRMCACAIWGGVSGGALAWVCSPCLGLQ